MVNSIPLGSPRVLSTHVGRTRGAWPPNEIKKHPPPEGITAFFLLTQARRALVDVARLVVRLVVSRGGG